MKKGAKWTRREFVRRAGLTSFAAAAAAGPLGVSALSDVRAPRFVYIGSGEGHIAVFVARGGAWKLIEETATLKPSSLVLHADKNVLYVVNEVDLCEHLPRGSVEAYSIREDGRISLLNRQPLSLSATAPRHAAIAPDGRTLVVAVHGGGAYNVLPIREDGSLARVTAIVKETGFGPDADYQEAAHPQMVVFDRCGHLLSADMGCDQLSVFKVDEERLSVHDRRRTDPGSGPAQMELHPGGNLLFVAHALETPVISYRYDSRKGRILESLCRVETTQSARSVKAAATMAVHPTGEFLYTACDLPDQAIATWRINEATGSLQRIHEEQARSGIDTLMVAPDGNSLLGFGRTGPAVMQWQIEGDGRISNPVEAAKICQPLSIAVKYA